MFLSLGLDCDTILGAQCLWNEYSEVVLYLSTANKHPLLIVIAKTKQTRAQFYEFPMYLWAQHSSLEMHTNK